jgi:hypothetical protein
MELLDLKQEYTNCAIPYTFFANLKAKLTKELQRGSNPL